ncbi:MAG: hypothetical protein ABEJ28_10870 [Salinigranum sp.]
MQYLYVVAAFALGVLLTSVGVASAAVYTPHAYTFLDTAVTAFTGACLQTGNLLVVSSLTAVAFDVLASSAGVDFPFLVPAVLGYGAFHLLMYRSSMAVTTLQGTPYDPNVSLPEQNIPVISSLASIRTAEAKQ